MSGFFVDNNIPTPVIQIETIKMLDEKILDDNLLLPISIIMAKPVINIETDQITIIIGLKYIIIDILTCELLYLHITQY